MNAIIQGVLIFLIVYVILIVITTMIRNNAIFSGFFLKDKSTERVNSSKTLISAWNKFDDAVHEYLDAIKSLLKKRSNLEVYFLCQSKLPQYWKNFITNFQSKCTFQTTNLAHSIPKSCDVVIIIEYDGYTITTSGIISGISQNTDILANLAAKHVMVDITLQPYIEDGEISITNTSFIGGTSIFNGENNGNGKTVIATSLDDVHKMLNDKSTTEWGRTDYQQTVEAISKIRQKLKTIATKSNRHRLPVYHDVKLPCSLTNNLKERVPSSCYTDKTSKCHIIIDWRKVKEDCRDNIDKVIPNLI